MLKVPDSIKRYNSAKDRFVKPAIMNFFSREFPKLFGPTIRENIADELINIFKKLTPHKDNFKPGQIFWNALDKSTRADSMKRKYVPVILTVINDEDIDQLAKGVPFSNIQKKVIARIIIEAYQQGGILSMRDISLLTMQHHSKVSQLRKQYEQENDIILPHTGVLHDMGSCITHKKQIIYKIIVEKKDPVTVAGETNHSQRAVDNYLKDYYRVNLAYQNNPNINYIHLVTNIAKPVIKQYIELIEIIKKNYAKKFA